MPARTVIGECACPSRKQSGVATEFGVNRSGLAERGRDRGRAGRERRPFPQDRADDVGLTFEYGVEQPRFGFIHSPGFDVQLQFCPTGKPMIARHHALGVVQREICPLVFVDARLIERGFVARVDRGAEFLRLFLELAQVRPLGE